MRPILIKTYTRGSLNAPQQFLVLLPLEGYLLTIRKYFQFFEMVLLYSLVNLRPRHISAMIRFFPWA